MDKLSGKGPEKATKILKLLALSTLLGCGGQAVVPKVPWPIPGQKRDDVKNGDKGAAAAFKEFEGCRIPTAPLQPPLRRLNAAEFDNTAQQILGTRTSFAAAFSSENRVGSFDNAIEDQVTSTATVEKYWSAAEALAGATTTKYFASCLNNLQSNCFAGPLERLGSLVYRRPLFSDERNRLLSMPQSLLKQGASPAEAMTGTAMAMFLTPQFLFRSNLAEADQSNTRLFSVAERLSYFLWSSKPDETLMSLARTGKLADPDIVRDQVIRMLEDPRANAFVENFAGQWLGTRQMVKNAQNNQGDVSLAQSFESETLAFFRDFITNNLNVRNLLDAKFSYVNGRLANHYGLNLGRQFGEQLERVDLQGVAERGGLLTQGAFLLQTSNPNTTSPVKRGIWLLEHILCSPPKPAPSDQSAAFAQIDPNLPMRERLAQHRKNPSCAGCHVALDPLGLGFENYDFVGKWRTLERGQRIDASGSVPGLGEFSSAAELTQILQNDPRFPVCVARKVSKYALGREPSEAEMCVVNRVAEKAADPAYGLRDLLVDLSLAFLTE